MKLLVVGGSSGIGRAVATCAAASGHDVVVAARRTVDDFPSLSLDVRDEAAIARAFEAIDDLDAVVYAAGVAEPSPLADQSAAGWRTMLDTNVVGAALVARHAIPLLTKANGVMFFCSSTNDETHWWGLGAYGASKVALNRLIEGLRAEHPDVRFVRATIGPTIGTDFAAAWDPDLLDDAYKQWVGRGTFTNRQMPVDGLASVVVSTLETLLEHPGVAMPTVHLEPPGGTATR